MTAKFSGNVNAEWLADGRQMRLSEKLTYTDKRGFLWVAPAGCMVDGASIPRFFWRFIGGPFSGTYRRASVVHDVFCKTKTRRSIDVHAVFFEMMRHDGVGIAKASLMWAAVRFCGPRFEGVAIWNRKQ